MTDYPTAGKLVLGDTIVYPAIIRRHLRKSHYWLTYSDDQEQAQLWVNSGGGGEPLMVFRRVPYEAVARLAADLGLSADGPSSSRPARWSKWNPRLTLRDDGSKDAERLRTEMLKLGIPHQVVDGYQQLSLADGQAAYSLPMWSVDQLLKIIRDTAERYQDQLNSRP